jgi:glycerol-3-phosphate dehydrogenase
MRFDYDILVIGGGINGTGTAADLAGRGLKVMLVEKDDLGSHTSSASSRLIHGGLRYLENYEFSMVRESLLEQKRLLHNAPHLVTAQEFILPVHKKLRPLWMLKLGLWLYDHILLSRTLPKSSSLKPFVINNLGIKAQFTHGLSYYDCKVDDSRLVIHVALLAKAHNAKILTQHKVIRTQRLSTHWVVIILNQHTGEEFSVSTKVLINASGPFADKVNNEIIQHSNAKYTLSLIKGSHIIVNKLFAHDKAFILQNHDNRVVFVIPFLDKYHLIGTTEQKITSPTDKLSSSSEEIEYLCTLTNEFFNTQISPQDVISEYAGVRPLINDNSGKNFGKISRDYKIEVNTDNNFAPLVIIYGGKLTTYRHLSFNVAKQLLVFFPKVRSDDWTKHAFLPGGNIVSNTQAQLAQQYHFLSAQLLKYYFHNFGTRTSEVLQDITSIAQLGTHFGDNLYQQEIDYLIEHEWVTTSEDLLWRRGKLGLSLTPAQSLAVAKYINGQVMPK